MTVGVAVFASGSGSNLQALLDRAAGDVTWEVCLVLSDRPGAGALDRARRAGVATEVLPDRGRDPDEVAAATLDALDAAGARAVALAGYLRLVPAAVVRAFAGRMLNIHPALLPAFGGKGMYGRRVHEAVLASGARVSGPTIHRVDEEYDRGTIVAQWPVPVHVGDTAETLARRVLAVEHLLYPAVVAQLCSALAEGREMPAFSLPEAAFAGADPGPDGMRRAIERSFAPPLADPTRPLE